MNAERDGVDWGDRGDRDDDGRAEPSAAPGLRTVVLVVSDCNLDPATLVGRVAKAIGTAASVSCWPAERQSASSARPTPPAVSRSIRVMVASGRKQIVGAVRTALAKVRQTRLTDAIEDPACLLQRLAQRPPGLLLIDEPLLDRLPPESIAAIHARAAGVRVLLLCDAVRPGLAERVLRHDFHGFLLTGNAPESWAKAIGAVGRGELWLPRAMLQKVLCAPFRSRDDGRPARLDQSIEATTGRLTRREAQIVEQLREGLSNKEIAVRLGVCEDTVKKHLQSVFGKLGVRRRALLVLGRAQGPLPLGL